MEFEAEVQANDLVLGDQGAILVRESQFEAEVAFDVILREFHGISSIQKRELKQDRSIRWPERADVLVERRNIAISQRSIVHLLI